MDDETQALIDAYKRPDGVMDWYKVLDVPRSATQEQIRDSFAILSATFGPGAEGRTKEDTVRHVLLKQAFAELDDPARRKKYEAFLRHGQDHARLLVAIESERQKQQITQASTKSASGVVEILSRRVDSHLKRIALVAFPFLVAVALFRLSQDLDHYSWEPSLSFVLFAMASALCLLIAFTKFGNWLSGH